MYPLSVIATRTNVNGRSPRRAAKRSINEKRRTIKKAIKTKKKKKLLKLPGGQ